LLHGGDRRVYLEDEGRLIGRIALPVSLRDRMQSAPVVVVEEGLESRIEVVMDDYIRDLGRRYAAAHGEEGPRRHRDKLQDDLARIRRRLGGARHAEVSRLLDAAFDRQWRSGSLEGHRAWIAYLLERYYDPMYDYQLTRREGERLFCGSRDEVVAWVADQA
jgi:tRNA 2-selenouridine synthase